MAVRRAQPVSVDCVRVESVIWIHYGCNVAEIGRRNDGDYRDKRIIQLMAQLERVATSSQLPLSITKIAAELTILMPR